MKILEFFIGLLAAILMTTASAEAFEDRPRARDLGIKPGLFPTGEFNAITDVPGVRVGQITIIERDNVRTGVTAILPHGGNLFEEKVAGAVFVGNGFGKLAGSTQVEDLGTIEAPIVLTNTLSVGTAIEAVVAEMLTQAGNESVRSINVVVGETNDGTLNDIRGQHVTRNHVIDAIRTAKEGEVAEGNVGAGTGTICFGWKGGIGTASRALPDRYGGYRLGILVQSNFGGVLTIDGAPIGRKLGQHAFANMSNSHQNDITTTADGSCMIVVATNAPLDSRDLRRLAARAVFGLARTGSSFTSGSGDYAIAFSTAPDCRYRQGDPSPKPRSLLSPDMVSPLFQAALEATEEAVYNSMFKAETMTGRGGRTVEAIPIHEVTRLLRQRADNE